MDDDEKKELLKVLEAAKEAAGEAADIIISRN